MLDVSQPRQPAELDAVFFALSDQTRRGLLGRLRGVELTAGALADGFHVTRPAVSRHLRILREAHLVSEKRRGRERVYTLTAEPLAGATTWLEDYRAFWSARLAELKSLIESLPDDPSDAQAAAHADVQAGARADVPPDAPLGTPSDAQAHALAVVRTDAQTGPQPGARAEAQSGARADAQAGPQPGARAEAQSDARADAQADARSDALPATPAASSPSPPPSSRSSK